MTGAEAAGLDAPEDLAYSDDHLWARPEGENATIGVTAFACDQLGDVVYLELPAPGVELHRDEPFGVIESVKSVSDLYAPVTGRVIERNDAAVAAPETVNESPYGSGWLVRMALADPGELRTLKDAAAYREMYHGG